MIPPNIGLSCTPTGNADHQVEQDEVLFVGIVEHLQLPVPVRQLPRHLQRRLEIFFKFALPVPPCNGCGDTSGVRFRYFNNANKSSLLQPRYQCFSPCCCCSTTTAANPKSTSTLFSLNQKKYAAHLQLHGGLQTILQNNRIILNKFTTTSENDVCQQGATSKLLPLRRPPTLRAPAAATQQPAAFLPARFQAPPTMSSYGFNFSNYDWRATTTMLPNTEIYSIDEGAGTACRDNFSSECQELRQENTSTLTGAFAEFPAGGQQLLYSTGNASHLNLINQSAVQSSTSCTAEELDEALKVVESGLEEDICIMNGGAALQNDQDLQSIELIELESIDLPEMETIGLPDLEPMDLLDLVESTNDDLPDLADSYILDLPADLADLPDLTEFIDLPDLETMDMPDLAESTNDLPDLADSILDLPAGLADLPDLPESYDLTDIADSMDSAALDLDRICFDLEAWRPAKQRAALLCSS